MPTRVSLLFQMTTTPANRQVSRPHTAGWSESFWQPVDLPSNDGIIGILARARQAILPEAGAIIGFRLGRYILDGNRLKPTGTATGKFNLPGQYAFPSDQPQASLQCSATAAGAPNTSRFSIRGIPDGMILGGEYDPGDNFSRALRIYLDTLVNDGWNFLARDITVVSSRVVTIVGNVLTTEVNLGAGINTYVRLLRVYDVNGNPVKGTFRVSSPGGNSPYTLVGLPAGVEVQGSGSARLDRLALRPIAAVEVSRAVVRKVGSPFERYRGRASKKRR